MLQLDFNIGGQAIRLKEWVESKEHNSLVRSLLALFCINISLLVDMKKLDRSQF